MTYCRCLSRDFRGERFESRTFLTNNTYIIFIFIYIIKSIYLHVRYYCTIPLIQENVGQLFWFVPLAQQTARNAPQTARNGRHRSSSQRIAGTFL